jgi:hypothetical protein
VFLLPRIARSRTSKSLVLANPRDLSGYNELPTNVVYHPIQVDPTLELSVEADAIRACHTISVGPVNMVLYNNSYIIQGSKCRIRSIAEDVHSVPITVAPGVTSNLISRVDLSWEVLVGNSWQKLAFLEFKRPGALRSLEWMSATDGTSSVKGSGEKICRQRVKYGYTYNVRYMAACTWDQLVLIYIDGERETWYSTTGISPEPIRAAYSWTDGQAFMKRNLYVFLRYALRKHLEALGFQVS